MFPRRRFLAVSAAAPLAAVLSACAATSNEPSVNPARDVNKNRYVTGDGSTIRYTDIDDRPHAPHLSGTTLQGDEVTTQDWAGEVIVLNFWAQWCAPCREEAPDLVEAAEHYETGVQFLGINVMDTNSKAQAFEKRHGKPYPSIEDPPGRLVHKFLDVGVSPNTFPTTLIIDREGRVASVWRQPITSDVLISEIDAELER
ncbi:TlpA family protein disulfide reductase [Natronoglycomyces albus]|uniref:TlpA family protein disulfide reductase n=1 Tax=Natronoglycomyces albus TaxID=2811108 RepID=A0A895XPM1_9ACTN|nr:TlpA disulfide reductase family protein [Natronoglycomyces albus]QSB05045.1 TlpA family protein disulfide reductase [Natronoglycomyces albus]